MNRGEQAPVGEVAPDWPDMRHAKPRSFARICLGVLLAQASASQVQLPEFTHAVPEITKAICEDQEAWCQPDGIDQDALVFLDVPSEPVQAVIVPEVATTVPVLETAPEPVADRKSCQEIVADVTRRVPVPDGWRFVCTTESIGIDGLADPKRDVITLYFGDVEDTNEDWEFAVAHEIAHAWQDELGILKAGFSKQHLEAQANGFAYAMGYRERLGRGSQTAAQYVCQLFRKHGAVIC